MPLLVECPSCSSRMNAPDKLAGKTVKCPKCQSAFSLPAPESEFEVVGDVAAFAPVKPVTAAADPGFELVEDDEPVVAAVKSKKAAAAPAFEVVEDDEPVVTAKPKKKSRPRIDDEDDYDDR